MSDIPDKPLYIRVCWKREKILNEGDSCYPAVNLRRNGLALPKKKTVVFAGNMKIKVIHIKSSSQNFDYIDIRSVPNPIHYWSVLFEVIDKKKFMLARIKFGI